MYLTAQRKSVLIVESDPTIRAWIRKRLEERNFAVQATPHAQAALQQLQLKKPVVICIDLVLPRESGYDLLEYLKRSEATKHIPVVVLSDRDSPLDRAHAEEAGARAYLIKPTDLGRLPDEVTILAELAPTSASFSIRARGAW